MKLMKKFVSLISCLLILSFLLQPLISFSPIFAEEIKMDYTDPNHLHAPKVVNGVSYEYDANGNLISDGERTIEWNEDNLPVKITKGDTEIKFYYDANGTRIAKEVKDATTSAILSKTIYINQYYQLSVIGNQSSVTKYYFAQGRRIATTQQQFTSHQQPVTNFYHHDHLGSTILATDLNSQPLSNSLAYFPYGSSVNSQLSVVSNQLSLVNKYLYTGQELDAESDLYNYNARLYNPKTGVFISADSAGSGNRQFHCAGCSSWGVSPPPGVPGGGGRAPQ